MPTFPRFLTVDEVADILRLTPKAVRDLIRAGEIAAAKIGQWKVAEEDLADFVRKRSNQDMVRFVDRPGDGEVGSVMGCLILDWRTEDPRPLTDAVTELVNSRSGDRVRWSFTWDRDTLWARHVAWAGPELLRDLLTATLRIVGGEDPRP